MIFTENNIHGFIQSVESNQTFYVKEAIIFSFCFQHQAKPISNDSIIIQCDLTYKQKTIQEAISYQSVLIPDWPMEELRIPNK